MDAKIMLSELKNKILSERTDAVVKGEQDRLRGDLSDGLMSFGIAKGLRRAYEIIEEIETSLSNPPAIIKP